MNRTEPPLIRLQGVRKTFGAHPALNGVDLQVRRGEVLALIGRSGSGKSTLLRTLNGLTPLDAGSIAVAGLSFGAGRVPGLTLRALRRQVGMVFQRFNLFPHLCARDNVSLAPRTVLGLSRAVADQRAHQMLDKVGLGQRADAFPHQLSGGQQQRVAIARALAMQPAVLLCDEITSALDPELTSEVLAVIRDLAKEGMTLLMATHEMAFARELADTLVYLQDGRIHESGAARTLFECPATPELARFIAAGG